MLNAHSLCNKASEFQDFISGNQLDLVGVSETWLTSYDDAVTAGISTSGYKFEHMPQPQPGNEVKVLASSVVIISMSQATIAMTTLYDSFEVILATLITLNSSTIIAIIYGSSGMLWSFLLVS